VLDRFMANEELARIHVRECEEKLQEKTQKRKQGLFTGLF